MSLPFLTAAADHADRRNLDIRFIRDEYSGWCAIVSMSDSRGTFSATIEAITRQTHGPNKETADEFASRVAKLVERAVTKARQARTIAYTKVALGLTGRGTARSASYAG